MNEEVTFFITRHGETMYNLLDKIQGWADTPLTSHGIETAKLLGGKLRNTPFVASYCSDSSRTVETAEIILKESGNKHVKLCKDKRLREWGFGRLEGEPNKVLFNIILKEIPGASISDLNYKLPQISKIIVDYDTIGWAEHFDIIEERVKSIFQDMADITLANGGGNVLVVTHAFLIKTLIYIFGYDRLREVTKIKNASITKIIYKNKNFKVDNINFTYR